MEKVFQDKKDASTLKLWWSPVAVKLTVDVITDRFTAIHETMRVVKEEFGQASASDISLFRQEKGSLFETLMQHCASYREVDIFEATRHDYENGDWSIDFCGILNNCIKIGPVRETMMGIGLSGDAFGILTDDNEDLEEGSTFMEHRGAYMRSDSNGMIQGDGTWDKFYRCMEPLMLQRLFQEHSIRLTDLGHFDVLKMRHCPEYNLFHTYMFIACLKIGYRQFSTQELQIVVDVDGINATELDSVTKYAEYLIGIGVSSDMQKEILCGRRERESSF
jgi:hypothetical protein